MKLNKFIQTPLFRKKLCSSDDENKLLPGENFIPPYPKPHNSKLSFFLGFFLNFSSWIHILHRKTYHMKLGKITVPKLSFWIVNDKSLIKRIMMDAENSFPKHHMFHETLEPLIGDGIFSSNGEKWKNQRKMINPSFAYTNLKKVFDMMNEAITTLMDDIRSKDLSKPIEIETLMTHVTADIIFRTILSRTLDKAQAIDVLSAFNAFQKHTQTSVILRLFKLPDSYIKNKVVSETLKIHKVFKPIIKQRYEEFYSGKPKKYNDILDALLHAKHPETGKGFSYEELADQVAVIFLAGHETSAASLTWTLYLISRCPHMQEDIFKEIKDNEVNEEITFDTLKKLKIIKNVFMESLRLYPPVSFLPREVGKENICMRGKELKKGDALVISPWLIHRSEQHWKDPHSFCPERFNDDSQKDSIKNSYLPFGKGQRVCIGAGFANQEAIIILARIIKEYKISNLKGQIPEPISRLTTRPKHGVKLVFEKR